MSVSMKSICLRTAFICAAMQQFGCQAAPSLVTGNYFADVVERRERELLADYPDLAVRQGKYLTVRLGPDPRQSNGTKVFEDQPLCEGQEDCLLHRLFAVDRETLTGIIYEQFYEGHAAALVNLLNGEAIDLEDVPHISPSGQYWVVADSDTGYGNGEVQIVARDGFGFKIAAADFNHRYCAFDDWRSDTTVRLYCPVIADGNFKDEDVREVVIAREPSGIWSERETGRSISFDDYEALARI